ncbi:MAG: hypothetical protein AAGA56_25380, partial [Myxococcota bacterium]
PAADLGARGDLYLDTTLAQLYGPKNEDGWGVPIVLGGDPDPDPIEGAAFLTGDGAPLDSLGEDGDLYIDRQGDALYGPKESGMWGTPYDLSDPPTVIASGWLDADWNVTDLATRKQMRIPINELSNNELRDTTSIQVYTRQFGTSSIYPLPSSGRWSDVFYSYSFGTNQLCCTGLLITLESTDGGALTDTQFDAVRGNRFRYVITQID